jgi:hypothetical protein
LPNGIYLKMTLASVGKDAVAVNGDWSSLKVFNTVHYRTSPAPGQQGNMLIAFHREPKWLDIIHVKTGDVINLFREFDRWLRRRLRQVRWKEWKRPNTRGRKLRALGLSEADDRATAASQKGYWHLAGTYPLQRAMPNAYWHPTLGLKGFNEPYGRFRDAVRTARCGPARRVVWEGPG